MEPVTNVMDIIAKKQCNLCQIHFYEVQKIKHMALLMFDEIISGFRLYWWCTKLFNVTLTFRHFKQSKCVPLSAIVGKKSIWPFG